MKTLNRQELYELLEERAEFYNNPSFIEDDPISIPHLFSKKQDREIAGFLSATIAWGQRASILRNGKKLMKAMDMEPYAFIRNFSDNDLKAFESFKHRTFNGTDCIFFLKSLKNIYSKFDSLENLFFEGSQIEDQDMMQAIVHFRSVFFQPDHEQRTEKHVSNPAQGSASKRLCMFLRWMVRKDLKGVDFGIWEKFSPSKLSCPLDVHSGRIARELGLLERPQNDWRAVVELTENLKKFDNQDPVKYDFALFGIGVNRQRV